MNSRRRVNSTVMLLHLMSFDSFARIVIVCPAAWLASNIGTVSYLVIRDGHLPHDLLPLMGMSFLALAVTLPIIYFPVMLFLRRLLKGVSPPLAFPLVASLLAIVPATFIIWWNSTTFGSIFRHLF